MPELSRAISNLKSSSTVAFNTKAAMLKRQGVDVVAMTAGEPDFQPPPHVLAAAQEAIALGMTKYTPSEGTLELREAICGKFARENGLSYTPEQVIVSSGGKQVLYHAFMAVLNPGDEVVLPAPFWVSYPAQIQLAGGVPVPVPTEAARGFIPEFEAIAAAVTERTKVILLNSPCNPTGAVYPPELIRQVAELAAERNIWLFSDDLYEHLIYEGTFATAAQFAPEHTLIIHGASKAYALTGWRIGYGAGPRALIAAMNRLQSQSSGNANAVAQHATVAALTQIEATRAFIEMTRQAYRERRERLVSGLNALGLKTPMPQGAFYAMADVTPIDPDEAQAALILLEQAHVGTVPGTDFLAPGQVRLSYATSLENIETALSRIAKLAG